MREATANTMKNLQTLCEYCGAQLSDAHFCSQCERIQSLAHGEDYFTFLGLAKKLRLDEAELEKSFYALSRRFHPDYFMNASQAEQQASNERSSMLNDAYRTLRDPVKRAKYLLSIEGYKEAEKKAPPDLLEEVFEMNMQLEEMKAAKKIGDAAEIAEARAAIEEALAGLNARLGEIDQRLLALFDEWDAALDRQDGEQEKKSALNQMSETLSHRSYIQNLVRDMKEEI